MKTIMIYKMTHIGDPDPKLGVWGVFDCMGSMRGWPFDAVIGIGGAYAADIANRVAWIGIGQKTIDDKSARGPILTFKHFLWLGNRASAIIQTFPRRGPLMHLMGSTPKFDNAINELLELAKVAPASRWGICKV
jgi:hypothetical protein